MNVLVSIEYKQSVLITYQQYRSFQYWSMLSNTDPSQHIQTNTYQYNMNWLACIEIKLLHWNGRVSVWLYLICVMQVASHLGQQELHTAWVASLSAGAPPISAWSLKTWASIRDHRETAGALAGWSRCLCRTSCNWSFCPQCGDVRRHETGCQTWSTGELWPRRI